MEYMLFFNIDWALYHQSEVRLPYLKKQKYQGHSYDICSCHACTIYIAKNIYTYMYKHIHICWYSSMPAEFEPCHMGTKHGWLINKLWKFLSTKATVRTRDLLFIQTQTIYVNWKARLNVADLLSNVYIKLENVK